MTATEGPSPTGDDSGPGPRPTGGDHRAGDDLAEGRAADRARRAGGGPAGGAHTIGEHSAGRRAADGIRTAAEESADEAPAVEDAPAGGRRGDTVAGVVRQWRAVHPGLDTGPMEVIGRINRCAALLQQAEDAPLRRAGLSRPEFDLLGALRRTGHELTPGELARETFSSGAAVTKRLKQLSERGLVERRSDSRDRRVAHLRLTDAGRAVVDDVLPAQLAYETAVLSGLDAPEQGELAALLGELLGQLEGRLGALRG